MITFRIVDLPEPPEHLQNPSIDELIYDVATYHYSVVELIIDGVDAYEVVKGESVAMAWDFLSQHIYYWSQLLQGIQQGDIVNLCIKRTVVDEGLLVSIQRDVINVSTPDLVDITFSHNIQDIEPRSKTFKRVSLSALEEAIRRGCDEYSNRVRNHYIGLKCIADSDTPVWNNQWKDYFKL